MRAALLLLLLACTPLAAAQPDSTAAVVRLELADGSVLVGTVVRESAEAVVFRTAGGAEVTVPVAQIRRREPFEGRLDGGRAVRFDPNRSRLFFAPTGRPLDTGSGYFAVYELAFPFVAYGITPAVSVAAGTPILPDLFGDVFYGAARVNFLDTPGASVAAGALVVGITDLFAIDCPAGDIGCGEGDDTQVVGIPFAVGTFGGPERAVTVGAGVPVGEGTTGGLLLLGGELQLSNNVKLLSENYLYLDGGGADTCGGDPNCLDEPNPRAFPVLSGGVRFFGERLAADLGVFLAPTESLEAFVPWVGFSYAFGR